MRIIKSVRHFVTRICVLPAMVLACAPAKAENILLVCSGRMTSQALGEANIENQTLDIDLDSGQMKGFIGDQIRVQSWNDRSIVFGGPTFLGPSGGGVVNRVTGELVFSAPIPGVPKVAFMTSCRPARQMF
jgi:hypothetical protein